jgi:hypothetical protein
MKIVAGTGIGAIVTGCTKDSRKMTEDSLSFVVAAKKE